MLYPAGTDRETDDVPTALGFSQGEGIRPDSITIDTTGSGSGSLLMFRDSFGELLYPFMAASWAEARFSRQSVYDLTTAAELGSDAVVVELVERNLFWLCEQRAVFPAPERSLDAAGAHPGSASLALDDGTEGYHHLYGTVGDWIDADSPVYIAYNGTYYEALIASEDFSATLPGSGGGEYGVYWYSDGILTRADLSI